MNHDVDAEKVGAARGAGETVAGTPLPEVVDVIVVWRGVGRL